MEQPALFLEIPNTYHASELGVVYRDLLGEGVTTPAGLAVAQRAAGANMSVDVAAGVAWVLGDDNVDRQPCYRCRNDAVVNLAIAAADATKPRVDRIVARVYDSQFFGAQNKWALEVIPGVATVGATDANPLGAAAIPNNAHELARVVVPAAAASIVNANIFDHRAAAQIGSGDWKAITAALTFQSLDGPTSVVTTGGVDLTASIAVGSRIKLTHAAATKYFIVTAIDATTITLYGGRNPGFTLAATAITNPSYSGLKAPVGFDANPAKWTEELKDVTQRGQAAPAAGTWYNPGALSLAIPIGAWNVAYELLAYVDTGGYPVKATLSTGSTTQSDIDFTTKVYSASIVMAQLGRAKTIALAAKTSYFLNLMSELAGLPTMYAQNSDSPLIIRAVCAYL